VTEITFGPGGAVSAGRVVSGTYSVVVGSAVPGGVVVAAGSVVEGATVVAALEATVAAAVSAGAPLPESSPQAASARAAAATGMSRRAVSVVIESQSYGRNWFNGSRPGSEICPMRAQVEETIEVIRPALQADGGDIVLRDVDETTGIVTVTLVGACGTCPASTQTLKAGIERIMRDRVDGVTEVVNLVDD
jgi:Fe-S cluster biogenesis protein NfuA